MENEFYELSLDDLLTYLDCPIEALGAFSDDELNQIQCNIVKAINTRKF